MKKLAVLFALFFLFQIGKSQCLPAFTVDTTNCPTVCFTDFSTSSSGVIVAWSWNFGDGNIANTPNVCHTYTANGTFLVCLTITTSNFCSSNFCVPVTISCLTPVCAADFTYGASTCPTITFSDNSTSSPGSINSYSWDFGDGGTSTQQYPFHTYTANGSYLTCLTVTTTDNCTSTYCDTLDISCVLPACSSGFSFSSSNCPTIAFTDSSGSSTSTITQYNWDLGDGSISALQNPNHTYTANGDYVVCLTVTAADSCTSTFCDTVSVQCIVPPVCSADFAYFSTNCGVYGFLDLSTSSPGTINSWSWDFGDGGTSNQKYPSHSYTSNGSYLVCLTVVTDDSCSSTYCDTVVVGCIPAPTCQASFQVLGGACPTFQFLNGSTTNLNGTLSYAWDFGDGNISTTEDPAHTFTSNGTYVVCLSITSSNGCSDVYCDTVAVSCIVGTCQADFGFTASNCSTFTFQDSSGAVPDSIVSWAWNFGDGSNSTLQNPSYSYTVNGPYLVSLQVTSSSGCSSTITQTVFVSCYPPPVANFSFSGCPSVAFSNNSLGPLPIVSFNWDFGDGNTSSLPNPINTYSANGSYPVCLSIMDSDGGTDTICDTVTVFCIPDSCQAGFNYSITNCTTVNFVDSSMASPDSVTQWVWSFGDGTTSTLENPSHSYLSNGTYNVTLQVTSAFGCSSSSSQSVTILCPVPNSCVADFGHTASSCSTIVFSDSSIAGIVDTIVSWNWNFGDGNTSTQQNPTHSYGSYGSYVVFLQITTASGCSDTYTGIVQSTCYPPCNAAFNYIGCPTVSFTDSSYIFQGPTSFFWDFGDGATSTAAHPSHTYTANGSYTVCHSIQTGIGCMDTVCETVVINCLSDSCSAGFSFTQNSCSSFVFTDSATSTPDSIVQWLWSFGDGTTSTQKNPSHIYLSNGTYTVTLQITSQFNCMSQTSQSIVVNCTTSSSCNSFFQWSQTLDPDIAFIDGSTSSPGAIQSWNWDFGDGGTSNLTSPLHTYSANGSYQVCLEIMTADSCTDTYCDSVTVDMVTGVNEILAASLQVKVFPNPATNLVNIHFVTEKMFNTEFELFDLNGKMLLQTGGESIGVGEHHRQFDVADLSEGIYILKMEFDGAMIHQKVVVRH